MFGPGLAKMHLAVDDARQDMQVAALQNLACHEARNIANPSDAAIVDGNVTQAHTIVVDDGGTFQQQIDMLGHFWPSLIHRTTLRKEE